jgi:hypothetical protein
LKDLALIISAVYYETVVRGFTSNNVVYTLRELINLEKEKLESGF